MTEAMYLVLIIEDDPGIRSILRTLLEAQHYRVTEADNGTRGACSRRETIDRIL